MDMNDYLTRWLDSHDTVDKDKIAQNSQERNNAANRSYLLNLKPEATIDLHGLYQNEAEVRLDNFIGECKRKGLKKILIIHGKGIHSADREPVLGELVRKFIERDPRCGTSGHPKEQSEGGSGATWVILK